MDVVKACLSWLPYTSFCGSFGCLRKTSQESILSFAVAHNTHPKITTGLVYLDRKTKGITRSLDTTIQPRWLQYDMVSSCFINVALTFVFVAKFPMSPWKRANCKLHQSKANWLSCKLLLSAPGIRIAVPTGLVRLKETLSSNPTCFQQAW